MSKISFSPIFAVGEGKSVCNISETLLFDLIPVSDNWLSVHFGVVVKSDSGSSKCSIQFFEHHDKSVKWVGWVFVKCRIKRCWSWEAEVLHISLSTKPVVLPLRLNCWCLHGRESCPLPNVKAGS